jgi:hypothetical protein
MSAENQQTQARKPKSKSNLRVAVLKRNLHKTFSQHHPDQYQQFLITQRNKQINRKKMIIAAVRAEIEANKNLADSSSSNSSDVKISSFRFFQRSSNSSSKNTAKQLPCYRYLMYLIKRKIMKN